MLVKYVSAKQQMCLNVIFHEVQLLISLPSQRCGSALVRVRKTSCFVFKIPVLVATNWAAKCLEVSFRNIQLCQVLEHRLSGPSTSDISVRSWTCHEGDVLEQVEMSVWYSVSYWTRLNIFVVCRDVNLSSCWLSWLQGFIWVYSELQTHTRAECDCSVCWQQSPLIWRSKISLRACRATVPCSRTLYKVDQLTQRWFMFTHEAVLLLLSAFLSVSVQMQLKCHLTYL